MSALRLANIPCSWGVLEFDTEQIGGHMPGHAQVLDEIARSGYEGTELGDWGFMPTDPAALRTELADRELEMVGAFVPVKLADLSAHLEGLERAVRTALLMAEAVGTHPLIILSDDNGTDATRTSLAGRVLAEHGLTRDQWLIFAEGAQRIARAVREQVGLRTVFHHHCAGFVETPNEVETFLSLTGPELIGLCFDTAHYLYGGGDALDGMRRHADRIWHVHFKACSPEVVARARAWSGTISRRRGTDYSAYWAWATSISGPSWTNWIATAMRAGWWWSKISCRERARPRKAPGGTAST